MINEKSLYAVQNAKFSKNFCHPLYKSYCFGNIPDTVLKLFGIHSSQPLPKDCFHADSSYDMVVFLFFDAFGWTFFEKFLPSIPFLKELEEKAIISKITSLFPSTTAAHVTCINTNKLPSETGIYEWFIYEPLLDRIITPLPYSFAGDHRMASLLDAPVSPEQIFPWTTFYQTLKTHRVESFVIQHDSIYDSPYSEQLTKGAETVGYQNFEEGIEFLSMLMQKEKKSQKEYVVLYMGDIDAVGHRKGTNSVEFRQIVQHSFELLQKFFQEKLTHSKKRIALFLTADHGMVDVEPEKTFYLNLEVPALVKNFKMGRNQKPLAPAGSCRDFFLHIKEEKLHETKEILQRILEEKAEIYLTDELIQEKIFGEKPVSQLFLNRVGNLVILPQKHQGVWWYEKNHFSQNFYAVHGGMLREEMEIPFIFLDSHNM